MQYDLLPRLGLILVPKPALRGPPCLPAHAKVMGTQVPCVDNCTRTTSKSYNCHRFRTCCKMQGKQMPQTYKCSQHKVNWVRV